MSELLPCSRRARIRRHVRGDARLGVLGEVAVGEAARTARPAAALVVRLLAQQRAPRASAARRRSRRARRRAGRARGAGTSACACRARASSVSFQLDIASGATDARSQNVSRYSSRRFSSSPHSAAKSEIMPEVVEIAPLRHLPHDQVLADQELDPLDVFLVDAQPAADRDRQPGADLAVRAAVGLADVVEQRPDRQRRPGACTSLDRLARDRERRRVIAARERVQPPDRVQRVLVDGVHVVDVVLHAARRRLPLGHDRGQQAQVLHLLEARRVGAVARVAAGARRSAARPRGRRAAPRAATRPARRAARACAAPAARPARSRPEKMRIISDGLLSKTASSMRLQRAVAHDEARVGGRAARAA